MDRRAQADKALSISRLRLPSYCCVLQVGTDIQDTKCSWLVVQALERATPEQRKLLEENYGVDEEKKVRSMVVSRRES